MAHWPAWAYPVNSTATTPDHTLPEDLYIPPDALEVFLETFEGPLDLLLYLIKRQHFDILDIPVASITRQYLSYIEVMTELRMELAAEYLVMAAFLTELKSRILLPKPAAPDNPEEDPRAELIRRLREYEIYKQAAEELEILPRLERDIFPVSASIEHIHQVKKRPTIELDQLVSAFQKVLNRVEQFAHHHIQRETLSIRERMVSILEKLNRQTCNNHHFHTLLSKQEGRQGAVVTFLALLELCREGLINLSQPTATDSIEIESAQ